MVGALLGRQRPFNEERIRTPSLDSTLLKIVPHRPFNKDELPLRRNKEVISVSCSAS